MLFALRHNSPIWRHLSYPNCISKLDLRICPAAPLHATQHNALPKIFDEASHGIAEANLDLLNNLRRVADDGSRSFRGFARVLLPRPMYLQRELGITSLEHRHPPALGPDHRSGRPVVNNRTAS